MSLVVIVPASYVLIKTIIGRIYLDYSSGTCHDWARGVANMRYAYTIELRRGENNRWVIADDEIEPAGEEVIRMCACVCVCVVVCGCVMLHTYNKLREVINAFRNFTCVFNRQTASLNTVLYIAIPKQTWTGLV